MRAVDRGDPTGASLESSVRGRPADRDGEGRPERDSTGWWPMNAAGSALHSNRSDLLSPESRTVVLATAGVVADHAEAITAVFYPRMFAAHPELLRVFNLGNQATGEQSRALAGSVVAYAVALIDPDAPPFDHVLRRIAYKHISLGIPPEQYTIVGRHLLAAVAEVLGDAVTPEVAAAWDEVYWLFATQLIAEEARLYQRPASIPAMRCARTGLSAGSRKPKTSSRWCWNLPTVSRLPTITPGPIRVGVRRPARREAPAAPIHRVLHGSRQPIADHREPGPRHRRRTGWAGFRLSARRCRRSVTSSTSAHRPATSLSTPPTARCCWPAPAPVSPRCCPSSSTSPGPNPDVR